MTCKNLLLKKNPDLNNIFEEIKESNKTKKRDKSLVKDCVIDNKCTRVGIGKSRSGGQVYLGSYKNRNVILKVSKLEGDLNLKNFNKFFRLKDTDVSAIREIIVQCNLYENTNIKNTNLKRFIPKVYDYGITERNEIYLIMENINGYDLEELVINNKIKFKNFKEFQEFLRSIINNLIKLYQISGFIHNDLKMSNIMLRAGSRSKNKKESKSKKKEKDIKIESPKGDNVVLIDFGRSEIKDLQLQFNLKNIKQKSYFKGYFFAKKRRNKDYRSTWEIYKNKENTHKLHSDIKFLLIPFILYASKEFDIPLSEITISNSDLKKINRIDFKKEYDRYLQEILKCHKIFS